MGISLIIPTFKNIDFLPELVHSIVSNDYDGDYEVLIGIDGCKDTLDYVHKNDYPPNFKFYFFLENKGPYLIKNTLSELSNYDNLLFFDSDDIMLNKMLYEIDTNLNHYDVIKPKYMNFTTEKDVKFYNKNKFEFGEGVFAIKKHLFLSMNGFEGWKVAADSDFMGRLYKTKIKILHTPHVLFHRRVHPNSLTVHPETGLASKLRGYYSLLSKKKTNLNFVNYTFDKSVYVEVDFNNDNLTIYDKDDSKVKEMSVIEEKKIKHDSISTIFTNTPTVSKVTSEPKKIDYQRINIQTNHNVNDSQLTSARKKAKLENIRKNNRR